MNGVDPLNAEERAACAVCADWLATGKVWSQAALLAVLAVLIAAATGSRLGGSPAVLMALLGLFVAERYLAVRVLLDARLFDRLARGDLAGLGSLDAGLRGVLALGPEKAGRSLPPRIAGARRLYSAHAVVTLLLVALSVVAWWRA